MAGGDTHGAPLTSHPTPQPQEGLFTQPCRKSPRTLLVFPMRDRAGLQVIGRDLFSAALVPKIKKKKKRLKKKKSIPRSLGQDKACTSEWVQKQSALLAAQRVSLFPHRWGGLGLPPTACWCPWVVPHHRDHGNLVSPLPPSHTHLLALFFPSPPSSPSLPCAVHALGISIYIYFYFFSLPCFALLPVLSGFPYCILKKAPTTQPEGKRAQPELTPVLTPPSQLHTPCSPFPLGDASRYPDTGAGHPARGRRVPRHPGSMPSCSCQSKSGSRAWVRLNTLGRELFQIIALNNDSKATALGKICI